MNLIKKLRNWFSRPVEDRLDKLTSRPEFRPVSLNLLANTVQNSSIELFRDAGGSIRHLRIGGWRVIAASQHRRIAEVRSLACGRVAVRIEREAPMGTTWELYDMQGHLISMLQTMHEKNFWLSTDFETGQVSHSPLPGELHLSA